jgi:hypothetical protein
MRLACVAKGPASYDGTAREPSVVSSQSISTPSLGNLARK